MTLTLLRIDDPFYSTCHALEQLTGDVQIAMPDMMGNRFYFPFFFPYPRRLALGLEQTKSNGTANSLQAHRDMEPIEYVAGGRSSQ